MSERTSPDPTLAEKLGPELASAFAAKGYAELTLVQQAVLAPELEGRDLRISSQTGSGKTLAIGLTLRHLLSSEPGPRALVVAPTRELAKQVETELAWLIAPLGASVLSLVGGSSLRDEKRGLSRNPTIVVGTPGRLLDHQRRGTLVTERIGAIVLDEADRMLDMGFREDIESLFAALPEERRTHLVSATFPRAVLSLAAKVQRDFAEVQGTPLGKANADIEHVLLLCHTHERVNALVNLLLQNRIEAKGSVQDGKAESSSSTLIFVRTRAGVADLARELGVAGFRVAALSGDLEQAARNRALAAFKAGTLDALIATDVAARGLDVHDVSQVIHADPPSDADTYTHRSGRTGRAGRKGKSLMLISPSSVTRAQRFLAHAKVQATIGQLPTRESILAAQDAHWFDELIHEESTIVPNDACWALAKRIVQEGDVTRALGRLLHVARTSGATEPRELEVLDAPRGKAAPPRERTGAIRRQNDSEAQWVTFQVSWGQQHGADPRRLVAMACRRGGIHGSDVGAIRIGPRSSTIDVIAQAVAEFSRNVAKPDPRDPRIFFRREGEHAARQDDGGGARRAPYAADKPYANDKAPYKPAAKRPAGKAPAAKAPFKPGAGKSEAGAHKPEAGAHKPAKPKAFGGERAPKKPKR